MNFLAVLLSVGSFWPINPQFQNPIASVVQWIHSGVGSLGLTIIIFTLCLKLITLPLDIWQKVSMKKSSLRTKKLQPLLEKIDKQYEGDSARIATEKRKVYQKHGAMGIAAVGTCLTMILTLVLFYVVFQGLQAYATYGNQLIYDGLINEYTTAYTAAFDGALAKEENYTALTAEKAALEIERATLQAELEAATAAKDSDKIAELEVRIEEFTTQIGEVLAQISAIRNVLELNDGSFIDAGQKAVGEYYLKEAEGFLWVKNLYRPDTWASFFPTYNEFTSRGAIGVTAVDPAIVTESSFNVIRDAVMRAESGYFGGNWNGLLIFPLLSIALSLLSMWITQRTQNVKGAYVDKTTANTNKMMMFIMPLMMAYFAFLYTAAFALYMVCNSFFSMAANIGLNPFIDKYVTKKAEKGEVSVEPSYSRKRK